MKREENKFNMVELSKNHRQLRRSGSSETEND